MATAASAAAAATQTEHHGRANATATTIAKSRWGPYSGAGDFAGNMAVILASLHAALALTLAIHAGVRHLLRRLRQRLGRDGGAAASDPEKPPTVEVAPAPALLVLVYSAAGTELVGAASECTICLADFADGDAVRAVPACGHGFHARCLERWLAPGGRRSSCPTCRAPGTLVLARRRPQRCCMGLPRGALGGLRRLLAGEDAVLFNPELMWEMLNFSWLIDQMTSNRGKTDTNRSPSSYELHGRAGAVVCVSGRSKSPEASRLVR